MPARCEMAVEAEGVEDIARFSMRVAAASRSLMFALVVFRCRSDEKRVTTAKGARRRHRFRDTAVAMDLVDSPVENDHLAVEVCERAEPKIAVLQDRSDADLPVIDPGDQRPGGRHLEQRVHRDPEILRQGCRDDRRQRLMVRLTSPSSAALSDAGMVASTIVPNGDCSYLHSFPNEIW